PPVIIPGGGSGAPPPHGWPGPGPHGGDPGADLLLARYARWRVKDVSETLAFTDGLVRWFAARRGPLRWLRSAGLLALGAFPELRRGVAWRGMGFANGPIPDLAQGRHAA
ncbi:MAG: hypothetical protein AAGA23_23610, partial [Pseudomonadota bacterium]